MYQPEDYDAVEDAMEFILNNPEEAQIVGQKGKEAAHQHFNALTETKKMIEAFEKAKR